MGSVMDRLCVSYKESVFSHITSLLSNRSLTFQQVLRNSYNCDPATLKEAIDTLVSRRDIIPVDSMNGEISYQPTKNHIRVSSHCFFKSRSSSYALTEQVLPSVDSRFVEDLVKAMGESIPEASPVYSQWWFSSRSYHRLLALIFRYRTPKTPTAFLACPTLGTIFSNVTDSPVQILDVDKILLTKLSFLCSPLATMTEYDAAANVPSSLRSRFGFVFVDPPWSRSQLETFLVRAAALALPGGQVAISLPPVLTRPFVFSEREKFFDVAQRLGLHLTTVLPSFTEYSVPDFEREAYQQIRLSLDKPWRTGDLFVFTKGTSSSIDIDTRTSFTSKWDQYLWGRRRLFLKRDNSCETGAPAVSVMPGMKDLMYNSTSSRSKSWLEASIVSSRNYIAHAQGRKEVTSLLGNIFNSTGNTQDKFNTEPHSFIELKKTIFSMIGISNRANNHRGV